jgi:diacylglycerol O-acyltransferase / wax synthase
MPAEPRPRGHEMTPARYARRRELAIGLGVYGAYLLARRAANDERGRRAAARNAARLVALERRLGLHVEPAVQQVLVRHRRLCHALNAGYVTLNVLLTIGLPIALFRRGHPRFPWLRRSVALSVLGASPIFVAFPCNPPRTLDGFHDTIKEISGVDLDTGPVAQLYNPIAAFPSIHMAFAVVTAAGVWELAANPALRAAAVAYPPAVAFTIFATGNHYVLDALAGSALGLAAVRVSQALER